MSFTCECWKFTGVLEIHFTFILQICRLLLAIKNHLFKMRFQGRNCTINNKHHQILSVRNREHLYFTFNIKLLPLANPPMLTLATSWITCSMINFSLLFFTKFVFQIGLNLTMTTTGSAVVQARCWLQVLYGNMKKLTRPFWVLCQEYLVRGKLRFTKIEPDLSSPDLMTSSSALMVCYFFDEVYVGNQAKV